MPETLHLFLVYGIVTVESFPKNFYGDMRNSVSLCWDVYTSLTLEHLPTFHRVELGSGNCPRYQLPLSMDLHTAMVEKSEVESPDTFLGVPVDSL